MKASSIMRSIMLLSTILSCSILVAQELEVTIDGLRDKNDIEKSYIVIDVENTSAKDLYSGAIKYINEVYKNPDEVLKGNIEGEYIKYVTHVSDFLVFNNSGAKIPIQANYTIELKFKDNKVRYEVIALEMPSESGGYNLEFTAPPLKAYAIYNKKGVLKKPETKVDIETYFNNSIEEMKAYLSGDAKDDDW